MGTDDDDDDDDDDDEREGTGKTDSCLLGCITLWRVTDPSCS